MFLIFDLIFTQVPRPAVGALRLLFLAHLFGPDVHRAGLGNLLVLELDGGVRFRRAENRGEKALRIADEPRIS